MSEKKDTTAAEQRLAEYQEASTLPLLVAGFLYTAALVVSLTQPEPFTRWLIFATWAAFVVDYLIQLWLAPIKWRFVVKHVPYLIALVFPPLRMYLLLVFSFRLFMNRNSSLRDRIGLAAGFAVLVIVVFGALLVLFFEAPAPGANIKTYGEALWWASVTVTTVGYGDYVPVTAAGRLVGVAVFSTGVASISVLTATVIGVFTDNARFRKKQRANVHASAEKAEDVLLDRLNEINARLIRLEAGRGAEPHLLSSTRRRAAATAMHESDPPHHREPEANRNQSPNPDHVQGPNSDQSQDPEAKDRDRGAPGAADGNEPYG